MAEYMTINNNIIEAIYCGDVEENWKKMKTL